MQPKQYARLSNEVKYNENNINFFLLTYFINSFFFYFLSISFVIFSFISFLFFHFCFIIVIHFFILFNFILCNLNYFFCVGGGGVETKTINSMPDCQKFLLYDFIIFLSIFVI